MFKAAQQSAQIKIKSKLPDIDIILTLSLDDLPIKYSLTILNEEICLEEDNDSLKANLESVLILSSCLSQAQRLCREPSDIQIIRSLIHKISKVIRPRGNLFLSEDTSDADKSIALCQTCHIANLGLSTLLRLLDLLGEDEKFIIEDQMIISILAFTSTSDPWTTQPSLKSATQLISVCHDKALRPEFFTNSILFSFIRPLFSGSKPKGITSSGRAAILSGRRQEPHDFSAWGQASKPWRLDTCYALTILLWAVENASQEIILVSFHLIIPPILILLDTPNSQAQFKGLEILTIFVQKMTPKILEQTGLGAVIEDAIHPILLYLPPITPLNESLSLLPAAYGAFFTLLEARFPPLTPSSQTHADQKQKLLSLTRLLRQAIIPAHGHSSISSTFNPMIEEIILTQLPYLIRALDIYSIAHLHILLSLISDILLDPFAPASISMTIAALRALRELVLFAWPRLAEETKRREVIRMLVSCWKNIYNERGKIKGDCEIRALEEVRVVGKLFVKAMESSSEVDLESELEPLLSADESLIEVFRI